MFDYVPFVFCRGGGCGWWVNTIIPPTTVSILTLFVTTRFTVIVPTSETQASLRCLEIVNFLFLSDVVWIIFCVKKSTKLENV